MNKIFVLVSFFVASVIVLAVAAEAPLPPYIRVVLLAVAMLTDAVGFASRYYMYLIGPMLKFKKHIVLSKEDAYHISSTADAVLRKSGDLFVATVYIAMPIYRSSTEMTDAEKLDFSKQVSRLVGISRDPVRFTTQVHVMNKDSYIQTLRDTISATENEQSDIMLKNASPAVQERVKGKLAMLRNMLDSITRSTSYEMVSYASLSATGSKEYEAVGAAQQRARELMAGIASTFGVSPNIITGENLLKFIEPEALIPFSTMTEQISKGIEEQVI
jgi:hypothetical protein